MDVMKQCLFVRAADTIQLPTMDYRYAGKPYRDFGFNGIAITDASPGENYTLQLTGVFAAKLDKDAKLESIVVGDTVGISLQNEIRYFPGNQIQDLFDVFGKVIAKPNPVSRRVEFMLVQWDG